MEFNINYVLENYERTIEIDGVEVKYLLYPSNSDKLIVCFTTLGPHIYERVRMLWEEEENWDYNILFLSDNNGPKKAGVYYLGETKELKIEKQVIEIINKVIEERNITYSISIGSSMGGYAALYFGIKLNFVGAIAVVPQINKETIDKYGIQRWKEVAGHVAEGNLPDIIEMIKKSDNLPFFYFQSGEYLPDKNTMRDFQSEIFGTPGIFVFDHFQEATHTSDYMHKELIFNIVDFFISSKMKSNTQIGGVS